MKKILFTCLLSACFLLSLNAQNSFSIEGKWKIVALEIDNVYKNYKTDSMKVSDVVKNRMKTDKDFNNELEVSIREMKTFEIIFTGKGTCMAYINGTAEPVENYTIDYQKQKMVISNSKMKKDDEVDFTYANGILSLKMPDETTTFRLELEKVN